MGLTLRGGSVVGTDELVVADVRVEGDRITAQALRRYGTEWSQFPSSSDDVSVAPAQDLMPLRDATLEFQRGYCEHLMERTGGDLNAAAELAGYGRRGLKELLVRLGLV